MGSNRPRYLERHTNMIAIIHIFNSWDPNFWSDLFVDILALIDIILTPFLIWLGYLLAKDQYYLELAKQREKLKEKEKKTKT